MTNTSLCNIKCSKHLFFLWACVWGDSNKLNHSQQLGLLGWNVQHYPRTQMNSLFPTWYWDSRLSCSERWLGCQPTEMEPCWPHPPPLRAGSRPHLHSARTPGRTNNNQTGFTERTISAGVLQHRHFLMLVKNWQSYSSTWSWGHTPCLHQKPSHTDRLFIWCQRKQLHINSFNAANWENEWWHRQQQLYSWGIAQLKKRHLTSWIMVCCCINWKGMGLWEWC